MASELNDQSREQRRWKNRMMEQINQDNNDRYHSLNDLTEFKCVGPQLFQLLEAGGHSSENLSVILKKYFSGRRLSPLVLLQAMIMSRESTTGNDDPQGIQNYPGLLRGK